MHFLNLVVVGALFPSLAPPSPSRLLSQVAELILRARLRECGGCDIDVSADPASLLAGGVTGVRVRGTRWCTPMKLSCQALDVRVGATAIDIGALARQRILLRKPAEGDATIRFTARDWDDFLLHPQMKAAIATRRGTSAAIVSPMVAFNESGGTQFELSGSVVVFPVRFDGVELNARLSQQADGTVECIAQPAPSRDVVAADAATAAAAGPWLAQLFAQLVIDLDGCALTFESLRVERRAAASRPELVLQLAVCVRSFPSLEINF